jgi:hypothetical protein
MAWIEDKEKQVTHEDLKNFACDLSSSQGSYGRICEHLNNMEDYEIDEMNEELQKLGMKNDLMSIIELFEG